MRRIASPLPALLCIALVAFAAVLYLAPRAFASDHQDSPLTVARPGTDITDVYVFPADDPSKVVLAMDVWPLIPPGLGPTTYFDPGVLYQLKIGLQSDATEDLVLQFKADALGANQRIALYGPARPPRSAPRPASSAARARERFRTIKSPICGNGVKAFAGPREDPFYFDLTQFYRLSPTATSPTSRTRRPTARAASARTRRTSWPATTCSRWSSSCRAAARRRRAARRGSTSGRRPRSRAAIPTPRRSRRSRAGERGRATSTPASAGRPTRAASGCRSSASGARRSKRRPRRSATTTSPTVAPLTDDATLAKSIHEYMIHTAGRSEAVAERGGQGARARLHRGRPVGRRTGALPGGRDQRQERSADPAHPHRAARRHPRRQTGAGRSATATSAGAIRRAR